MKKCHSLIVLPSSWNLPNPKADIENERFINILFALDHEKVSIAKSESERFLNRIRKREISKSNHFTSWQCIPFAGTAGAY